MQKRFVVKKSSVPLIIEILLFREGVIFNFTHIDVGADKEPREFLELQGDIDEDVLFAVHALGMASVPLMRIR